jgi:hypothetical protein
VFVGAAELLVDETVAFPAVVVDMDDSVDDRRSVKVPVTEALVAPVSVILELYVV